MEFVGGGELFTYIQ